MRASKKAVAVATCLVASVMASESFVDSGDFRRELHKGDGGDHQTLYHANEPENPVEVEYPAFTRNFAQGADTYGEDFRTEGWEPSQISLIGLAVGFATTGIFILFALINIIIDETKRHADFKNKVEAAKDDLRKEPYNYDDNQILQLEDEFEVRDAQDEMAALEAERKELAEIN